jgi:hypothetical protein
MATKRPSTGNRYHAVVCALCRAHGWPEPLAEVTLIPNRRFRCDLVWPYERLVCEVNGGAFIGGRHSRGMGQIKDWEKLNLLALDGWKVIQVSPKQVTDGVLAGLLSRAFQVAA